MQQNYSNLTLITLVLGAIKFVLSGANIMCPGLTHPNAKMTPCPENTVVAIFAEGMFNQFPLNF